MSYALKWHPIAYKTLTKLPKDIIQRVINKFDNVVVEPFRYLEHFEGSRLYKLRIGDYRALIEVDLNNQLLLVKVFDHRSRVYKK